jgi:hypothetical protein
MNGIHEVTGSIPVWSTISKLLISGKWSETLKRSTTDSIPS